ncbi:threonine--tRNA ligase [Candidatus Microgenomates bacterium]|nr:threonine--tRNA ligase [Candidatus Microgenomates bacterium]
MSEDKLQNIRHSCAHLLAAAVLDLWPGTHNAIGPAIEDGFYQDFDFGNVKISEADLPKIEKKMMDLISEWNDFQINEVPVEQAKKDFAHNPYKSELIEDFAKEGKTITETKQGNFLDLCKGGHSANPKEDLKYFKLLSIAGAYWRGSEKNKMLTRIYGTAFPTQKELDMHLSLLEAAKKNDHRKLGQELELFATSEQVGPGLILWLPKGNIIKEEIEKWAKENEDARGYSRVTTPHITKAGLYYTSGHLPYYKGDMYPSMKLDEGEEYYLKPMNCPHHHMIYASKQRSYRELPLRLAEYGDVYRYESSGELFGLMRVRGMAQNDAHIYCTPEQAVEEFVNVMKLHEYYYQTLGIKEYHLELALRDPKNKEKYHGDETMWERAEKLMREAVSKLDIKMVEQVGNAAFYGPKIDFIVHSSIGREFAISTNQIDLYMGDRFGLKYIDNDGKEQAPVIIHRAPLGSHERFLGFLIEHFGGAFPLWLSPVQVVVIPVTDRNNKHAQKLKQELASSKIRTEVDDRSETMQSRIRDAEMQKVPYIIVVGDKEEKKGTVAIRTRGKKEIRDLEIGEWIKKIDESIENRGSELV